MTILLGDNWEGSQSSKILESHPTAIWFKTKLWCELLLLPSNGRVAYSEDVDANYGSWTETHTGSTTRKGLSNMECCGYINNGRLSSRMDNGSTGDV